MILVVTMFTCAVFSLLSVRKLFNNKRPSSSQCRDMISELPDEILISILARLPIKRATRLSILSSRWRNLPRSLSNIGFICVGRDSHKPHDPNINIDFVNRFLKLRSGSKIHNFQIYCCLNNSVTEKVKQCIHSLGKLGVEKLVLDFCCRWENSGFSFSCHLLSELPSLQYCELSFCTLQPSLRSHCSSRSLKVLILTRVTVPPGAIECILSICSSLQELGISRSYCPSKLCFRAPNLQLKSLGLGECPGLEEIEFYASNLQVFMFYHTRLVNFIFGHVPQLQAVYLNILKEDVVPYVATKLAKDVPNLRSLDLVTRGDIYKGSRKDLGINMFANLRQLGVAVYSVADFHLVIALLQSCPLLEELCLHLHVKLDSGEAQLEKQIYHQYSKLKKTEISGFAGTENDIELALYILKSATGLEEMGISRCLKKMYVGRDLWIPKQTPWNVETSKMIHTRLQGQEVSSNAKVIIQHQANAEDHLWGGAEEYCQVSLIHI